MQNFKTKELEDLSKQILDRAVQRGVAPSEARPSVLGRIRQIGLRHKLPRLLRKRF